ncbi:PfkB family carbohydrate kinase [Cerasibacillus sp. JNUCC 74]
MKREQTANKHVLIIGAAVIDMIVHVNQLPKTGEDIYGKHVETMVGGCAYNVQQVINHFGINHDLFVPVGIGPHAHIIRTHLEKQQIPIILEDTSKDNGWNISFVEPDGERTFLTIPGLETKWRHEWFQRIHLADYDYIYLSGYELEGTSGEVLVQEIIQNKANHAKIIFDPGPRIAYLDKAVLETILTANTIVHCNLSELKELMSVETVEEGATFLYHKTKEAVVITMGAEGCFYLDKDRSGIIPAKSVKVVDTIGAGDSHTGAFISGLAQGLTLEEACQLGNRTSEKIVQQSGCNLANIL